MNALYVITPCKNAQDTINETITSVVSQGGNFELHYHIQDALSSDKTIQIIKRWKRLLDSGQFQINCLAVHFSYASEPDNGLYHGVQKGYDHLNIECDAFMTWINADDVFMPHAFATILAVTEDINSIRWITGQPCHIKRDAIVKTDSSLLYFPQDLLASGLADYRFYHFLQQEGTFWKNSLFMEVGGLNIYLKYAGDFDLWMRMAKIEQLWSLPNALACFRNRKDQLSNNINQYLSEVDQCVSFDEKIEKWVDYQANNNKNEHAIIDFNHSTNSFVYATSKFYNPKKGSLIRRLIILFRIILPYGAVRLFLGISK